MKNKIFRSKTSVFFQEIDMVKIKLPDGVVELFKLEKKYPDWEKTPDNIKEKIFLKTFLIYQIHRLRLCQTSSCRWQG